MPSTHGSGTVAPVEPLLSIHLRRMLGMSNALTFDIGNACAGMFTGIAIADALIKTGAVRRAMIVSGEWASIVLRTAQQEIASLVDQRIPCLTVGDAGAAVILEPSSDARIGFHEIDLYTAGRYSDLCIVKPTEQAHGGLIMITDAIRISLTSMAAPSRRATPACAKAGVHCGCRQRLLPRTGSVQRRAAAAAGQSTAGRSSRRRTGSSGATASSPATRT